MDIKGSSRIQSVERAIKILEHLAAVSHEMKLTEISRGLGWPKSTVHGILTTLRDYRYIDQSETTGCYSLGVRLFELGNIVSRSWDIRTIALPFMKQLNSEWAETVHLAAEDDGEVLYIEKLESKQIMRIVSDIGARLPMHCSGLGKVMLAHMQKREVKNIIAKHGMRQMTKRTITDLDLLEKELCRVREQGYAIDDREIMEGLCCVAAPIRNKEGSVKYALSVSLVNGVQKEHRMPSIISDLIKKADMISNAMGYRPNEAK